MKKFILALILLPTIANAGEFDYYLKAKSLYGYSFNDSKQHLPTTAEFGVSYEYSIATFYLDLYAGIDKELKDYNQGSWGQEAYVIIDTENIGQFQAGQMYNVAKQFYVGSLESPMFDISDFIKSSSWQRNNSVTQFATFNTTSLNTDGVAPKISYLSPEFYGTQVGFSYTPDAYNRRGLTTKQAKSGYVSSVLTEQDWGKFDISASASYAYFDNLDKEYSASIKISYGNYNIAGGYRKSNAIGNNVNVFDGYRNATAYDIGAGFEFGPYTMQVSYLNTWSDDFDYEDKVFSLSQSYQYNKQVDFYLINAYVDYDNNNSQTGYALIGGIGINF